MKTALLVIDVQKGMFPENNGVYKGEMLINNLKFLLTKARSKNTSIFYIQHNAGEGKALETGTDGWYIHPEIKPHKNDGIIQKFTPDSFLNTLLDDEFKKQNIKHVILTGIQTEACVDTTCRRAFSMGYKVTLVSDTHSTWDSGEITAQQIINHHNRVLQWFAEVIPAGEIKFI